MNDSPLIPPNFWIFSFRIGLSNPSIPWDNEDRLLHHLLQVLTLTCKSLNPFEVDFCKRDEIDVWFHYLPYGNPVTPTAFVKQSVWFPLTSRAGIVFSHVRDVWEPLHSVLSLLFVHFWVNRKLPYLPLPHDRLQDPEGTPPPSRWGFPSESSGLFLVHHSSV